MASTHASVHVSSPSRSSRDRRSILPSSIAALLAGLSSAPPRPRSVRSLKPLSPAELAGDALLEAIVAELHDVAADIIAVASAFNASRLATPNGLLAATRNFLPRTAVAGQLVSLAFRQADDLGHLAEEAAAALRNTEAAVRRTQELLDTLSRVEPPYRPAALHVPRRHWQAIAESALALIELLEPETRWRLSGAYTENALVLARALRQVVRGEAPAVGKNEEIARPALPQRRRAPRFRLEAPCTILHNGRSSRARTIDVSTGGLGLAGAAWLKLRDRIEIEVDGRTRRRLRATVVWSRETRIGVQLDTPLDNDDPLLLSMS